MKLNRILSNSDGIEESLFDTEITGLCREASLCFEDKIFFDLPSVYGRKKEYNFKNTPFAIITETPENFIGNNVPIIKVSDAREAYSRAYSNFSNIDYSKLKIIGVTGTNGKSSIATMIYRILRASGKSVGLFGTGTIELDGKTLCEKHYSMTTPDPELLYPMIKEMQNGGAEYIVMEVSSHSLALNKCEPIPFNLAVFSCLSPEHMDFHKDMEEYFLTKRKLFLMAERSVINTDSDWGKRLYSEFRNSSVSVGINTGNIRAKNIRKNGLSGSSFLYEDGNEALDFTIHLPGEYNIQNALLAICSSRLLGISLKECENAVSGIEKIEGRFEVTRGKITVIRDFAHTPLALENLLKTVKSNINTGQTLTVVLGCGGERDKTKRPVMAKTASEIADRVIICEDNPRNEAQSEILRDIIEGLSSRSIGIIADRRLAIRYAISSSRPNDVVVIAGKGQEKYIEEKHTYRYFDERIIIEEALAEYGG